jgi:hypothetical protein
LNANSKIGGASDDEMTMAAMGIDRKLQREYGADYVGTEEYFTNHRQNDAQKIS